MSCGFGNLQKRMRDKNMFEIGVKEILVNFFSLFQTKYSATALSAFTVMRANFSD